MHWLLIGYMFLFIHRPFEVWPALGDLRVERVYMCATLAVWVLYPGKRWLSNPMHAAYAAFEENDKGSIEAGKLADFTVLSGDIMKIAQPEILKTRCEMTVIGGEIVYQTK